jgi:cardiolipin synthase
MAPPFTADLSMVTTLPNILTVSRILVIPLIIGTFYIDGGTARWIACGLFIAAAVTDFFDGYVARRRNSVSSLGRFLDPIADKLLVAAVLLMLTAFGRVTQVSVLPAVVILLREILVSGLREFLADLRVGMPVSNLAKWKTGIQMTALPALLVGDAAPYWLPAQMIGEVCLWAAAVLTLITGWDYLRAGLKHMHEPAE